MTIMSSKMEAQPCVLDQQGVREPLLEGVAQSQQGAASHV